MATRKKHGPFSVPAHSLRNPGYCIRIHPITWPYSSSGNLSQPLRAVSRCVLFPRKWLVPNNVRRRGREGLWEHVWVCPRVCVCVSVCVCVFLCVSSRGLWLWPRCYSHYSQNKHSIATTAASALLFFISLSFMLSVFLAPCIISPLCHSPLTRDLYPLV